MKETDQSARGTALEILMKYEKEGKKLGPLLLSVIQDKDITDKRDLALIKILTEGTVERLITLDYIIDLVSKTKTARMKSTVRMIIRLGTFQLVFMDSIPDRAAVNESVELAKKKHLDGLVPFVNGVLRAVAGRRDEGINYPDWSVEFSCPGWIADLMRNGYGEEKARKMLGAGMGSRPLYLRVNRCRSDGSLLQEKLRREGYSAVRTDHPYTLVAKEGHLSPADSESFALGLYSVQDLSSQLAMYDLCEQIKVYIKSTKTVHINVFDLCSAPGGKTCFAAEMLTSELKDDPDKSFCITAFDISDKKLSKVRENLSRTGTGNVRTEKRDASEYDPLLEEKADIIIADLPCTGLGVIGRKVDIKYRVHQEDVTALCKLQRAILDNAIRYLKPSGILMFSVCTVTKEETERQSEYIEKSGLHKISERLFLQGVDPCDGFYYSLWKKD